MAGARFGRSNKNLWFTAGYNLIGILLAVTGWLPPIVAAAAQSLPDVTVMLKFVAAVATIALSHPPGRSLLTAHCLGRLLRRLMNEVDNLLTMIAK